MKKDQRSIPAILRNIVCAALAFWLLLTAGQEGTHYHHSYGTKRAAYVAEYIFADNLYSSVPTVTMEFGYHLAEICYSRIGI